MTLRDYEHARSRKVLIGYLVIGVIWLFVSTPLLWNFKGGLFLETAFRALYVGTSAMMVFFMVKRELKFVGSRYEYEQLLGFMLEPVMFHRNGVIVDVNTPAVEFFGADSKEALIGIQIRDLVHDDFKGVVLERIDSLTKGHATELLEEKFLTLQGFERDVEVTGIPVTFREKPAVLVIFRDITERKKNDALLRDSENRLRTLINAIPYQICFIDSEERWTEANQAILQALGLDENSYRGKTALQLAEICRPEYKYAFLQNAQYDARTFGEITQLTHEHELPDGSFTVHEITRVPVSRVSTKNDLVVMGRDITHEYLARKQLEESEQRYRSLFENDGDMIVYIDLQGIILAANPASEFFTGYLATELVGRKYHDLIATEYQFEGTSPNQQAGDGRLQIRVTQMVRQFGEQIHVSEKKIPIFSDGVVSGYFFIVRDITHQKMLDGMVAESERLAAIGEMSAGIAHEIRNPLTPLKGFLQLMLQTNKLNRTHLEVMNGELDRIAGIVNELLDFSKPSVSSVENRNCKQLLQEVALLMMPQATMKNIVLDVVGDNTAEISCDYGRLKQVFVNLIRNSIEVFQNGGTIEVGVRHVDTHSVSMYVRDTGPGIPQDILNRVGRPFYTTKSNGTGLGLMVCRNIIDAHNGVLKIQSVEGQGTEVDCILPLHSEKAVPRVR